jgi:tetrahydromethanopterin S-methyltransferase subunit F
VGEKSRVRVLLNDKSEVKGYISQVDADSFQVTDKKNGQVTNIAYRDVDRIRGAGLSTGAKIAIGAGVAVGVVIAVALLSLAASGE